LAARDDRGRGNSDRGKAQMSKQDAIKAEVKASGRSWPSPRQETSRVETPRQTPSFGGGIPGRPGTVQQPTLPGRPGTVHQPTLPGRPGTVQQPTFTGRPGDPARQNQKPEVFPARSDDRRDNDRQREESSRQGPSIGKDTPGRGTPQYSGGTPGGANHRVPPIGVSQQSRPNPKPELPAARSDDRRDSRDNRDGRNNDYNRDNRDDRRDHGRSPAPVIRHRPDSSAYHRATVGPSRKPGQVTYRPTGYRPPTHSNGRYYYPVTQFQNKPLRYGNWYFGNYDPGFCRKSVYFHFGYFPYVQVARLWIGPYVSVTYVSRPTYSDYYLTRDRGVHLEYAMADIRNAWLIGRPDLITNHVRAGEKIAVLLDGQYDYSLDADDYLDMTNDAVEQIRTVSFTWTTTRVRSDGQYTAFGRHEYRDAAGAVKTIYVSYTLEAVGGYCYITEVGYSGSPLI
jgi:hypothetical protein